MFTIEKASKTFTDRSVGRVAYPGIKLSTFENKEVFTGFEDAALRGNRPGCVDIIASHHPDCNAGALALTYRLRNLQRSFTAAVTVRTKYQRQMSMIYIALFSSENVRIVLRLTVCLTVNSCCSKPCCYTLWTIKRWQYICNHNSGKYWWILISFTYMETGINTVCK